MYTADDRLRDWETLVARVDAVVVPAADTERVAAMREFPGICERYSGSDYWFRLLGPEVIALDAFGYIVVRRTRIAFVSRRSKSGGTHWVTVP